jgi:hypothetical protein
MSQRPEGLYQIIHRGARVRFRAAREDVNSDEPALRPRMDSQVRLSDDYDPRYPLGGKSMEPIHDDGCLGSPRRIEHGRADPGKVIKLRLLAAVEVKNALPPDNRGSHPGRGLYPSLLELLDEPLPIRLIRSVT